MTLPLVQNASPSQVTAILGAMRAVAETGGSAASDADQTALVSAAHYIFGCDQPFAIGSLPAISPDGLAIALVGSNLAEDAAKFLTVMAFVDGQLDKAKIATVLRFAEALGVHAHYLEQIADAARDRLQGVLADMTRCNMESITNRPWQGGDVDAWLLPYRGDGADPALEQRFLGLANAHRDSFGHAFWVHFEHNGYTFPGNPTALNAAFCVPHDSVHVLTGYDTSARGEILTSTFTAAMHKLHPMAGHVLPVIFSWHLSVQINDVARNASNALDPAAFWQAWADGAAATIDTFAPGWDFWSHADAPLAALRRRWSITVADAGV